MANPQSWNRYSYVLNNPINTSDPTGHYCVGDMEGCRDDVNGDRNGDSLYLNNNNNKNDEDDDDGDECDADCELSKQPELILACGQGAGEVCNLTTAYDGLPLAPYYQLSAGAPTLFGNDGAGKLLQALAIYNYIKMKPGQYNLVGHSAGGSALIIVARLLLRDGLGDRINNLVLLDPAMDDSYNVDEKGSMGNLQYEANLLAASGITVFLGDSLEAGDGNDVIAGAIDIPSSGNHFQLANDPTVYNSIITDPRWKP